MRARVPLLVVLLAGLACAACSSTRPRRDYSSLNKRSVKYLGETHNRELRKQSWDMLFKGLPHNNARLREESLGAAWQTLSEDEIANFQRMLKGIKNERKGWDRRLENMRFGFLDSGK